MSCTIHVRKAHRTPEGWVNPRNMEVIKDDTELDLFILEGISMETGNAVVTFFLDRTALEQLEDGMTRALTVDPVEIRLA